MKLPVKYYFKNSCIEGEEKREMKKYMLLLICILFMMSSTPLPDYKNSTLPVEQRVADLLKINDPGRKGRTTVLILVER